MALRAQASDTRLKGYNGGWQLKFQSPASSTPIYKNIRQDMTTALSIQNLKKVYGNSFEALKGISLEVQQGDFFALLGPNGAGKSTTLGIVSSLVNQTAGKVSIFGYDIDTQLPEAKRCLGVVPQEFNFN